MGEIKLKIVSQVATTGLRGPDGKQGEDGASAYKVWLDSKGYDAANHPVSEFLGDIKGADGDPGAPGHNPCLGVFADDAALPSTDVQAGDYAYATVTDSQSGTSASHIFRYDGTAWTDNGVGSPDNVAAFDGGSGPAVASVKIVDDLTTGGATDVLSAEAGKLLDERLYGEMVEETGEAVSGDTATGKFSSTNSGEWLSAAQGTNSNYKSKRVEIGETWTKITITANSSKDTYFTFTKQRMPVEVVAHAALGDYLSEYHTTGVNEQLSAGETATVPIPRDAKYIYFLANSSSTLTGYAPESVVPTIGTRNGGTLNEIRDEIANVTVDVADNLTTDDATIALSAAQGKMLADLCLETVEGDNILDPESIVSGKYVQKSTGNQADATSLSSYTIGCTDYIPLHGGSVVCNAVMATVGSDGCPGAIYDSNKAFVRALTSTTGIVNYDLKPDGEDWAYVRYNLKAGVEPHWVNRGNVLKTYSEYVAPHLEMRHSDSGAEIPTEEVAAGNNLCNPEEITTGKYINASTGVAVGLTGYSVTGYIPIDERGVVCDAAVPPSGNYIGWAYYKEDKTFLAAGFSNSAKTNNGSTTRYAAWREGAAYVRFTVKPDTDVMVNKGAYMLPYEEYSGTTEVIPVTMLPDAHEYNDGVRIVVPGDIYIPNNGSGYDTVYLYWRSMATVANPESYDCVAAYGVSKDNNYIASFRSRYVKIVRTATSTGNNSLVLAVRGNDGALLATKTVWVRHIARPSNPATVKHVLLIGASRNAGGETLNEAMSRLNLSNVVTVGRRSSTVSGVTVRHEAEAGKKISDIRVASTITIFFHIEQGTEVSIPANNTVLTDSATSIQFKVIGGEAPTSDKQGNLQCKFVTASDAENFPTTTTSGSLTNNDEGIEIDYTGFYRSQDNPFYNGDSTHPTDFAYYSNQYCDNATIDVLILSRGANDLSNNQTVADIVGSFKAVVDDFHTYNENGKVVINLEPLTNPYYAGYRPGNFYSSFMASARAFWSLHERLIALAESDDYKDFVVLSNACAEFDHENLYGATTASTGRRPGQTEKAGGDYIHYTDTGKLAVADSLYHAVAKCINDINAAEEA